MEAGPSLRELFAELSRTGADPAELLHAAGYGDVPEPLMAEAIASYAGTAPLEVAEHLAPFAVAHGPVPDPEAGPANLHSGLSLLASAPPVDALDDGPAVDLGEPVDPAPHGTADDPDPDVDHVDHVDHVDAGHLGHVDVDPSALDFGAGHEQAPVGTDDGPVDHGATEAADHDVDTFLAHEHVDDVDVHVQDVSHHDLYVNATEPAATPLDHDDHPDPTDLLDGDEPHHA